MSGAGTLYIKTSSKKRRAVGFNPVRRIQDRIAHPGGSVSQWKDRQGASMSLRRVLLWARVTQGSALAETPPEIGPPGTGQRQLSNPHTDRLGRSGGRVWGLE